MQETGPQPSASRRSDLKMTPFGCSFAVSEHGFLAAGSQSKCSAAPRFQSPPGVSDRDCGYFAVRFFASSKSAFARAVFPSAVYAAPRLAYAAAFRGSNRIASVRLYTSCLLDELLRSKDRFRNHSMNAFGAVHGLCDMIVDGHARNHVGLLACEMRKSLRNEIDSFAHGDLHRIV
jgi:hypothetical protein